MSISPIIDCSNETNNTWNWASRQSWNRHLAFRRCCLVWFLRVKMVKPIVVHWEAPLRRMSAYYLPLSRVVVDNDETIVVHWQAPLRRMSACYLPLSRVVVDSAGARQADSTMTIPEPLHELFHFCNCEHKSAMQETLTKLMTPKIRQRW